MTKREFEQMFREEILPHLATRERGGFPDKPGRRQAWNDTVDSYMRDGSLPKSAGNWGHPRWLETWQPKRRDDDYDHARVKTRKSPAQLDREIGHALAKRGSFNLTPSSPSKLEKYTKEQLEKKRTLSEGHMEDLKVEGKVDGIPTRWWLSRMTRADGARNSIDVEQLIDHRWQIAHRYGAPDAHSTIAKGKRVPKTQLMYVVQGNYGYGQGWEDVTAETDRKESLARLREYRENSPGSHRLIKRREKITH
jgi:hypothetical protein